MDTRHGIEDYQRTMRIRNFPDGRGGAPSSVAPPVVPPAIVTYAPRVDPLAPGMGSLHTTMPKSAYPVEMPWRYGPEAAFAPKRVPRFDMGAQSRHAGRPVHSTVT